MNTIELDNIMTFVHLINWSKHPGLHIMAVPGLNRYLIDRQFSEIHCYGPPIEGVANVVPTVYQSLVLETDSFNEESIEKIIVGDKRGMVIVGDVAGPGVNVTYFNVSNPD